MDKTTGIKVCSVLLIFGGLMQLISIIGDIVLIGFVGYGSLLVGLAMFMAAYGIWSLKN